MAIKPCASVTPIMTSCARGWCGMSYLRFPNRSMRFQPFRAHFSSSNRATELRDITARLVSRLMFASNPIRGRLTSSDDPNPAF